MEEKASFMDMYASKKYYFLILIGAIILVVAILIAACTYLSYEQSASLKNLNYIENENTLFYDRSSEMFLEWSEDKNCFFLHDEKNTVKYDVSFRRGMGKYLFVIFNGENEDTFTGDALITENGNSIVINCESQKYSYFQFVMQ